MKKRAMAAVSAVMCASMVLSACGSSASTSTTAAPAETKAAEESKTEETTAAAASGDVVTINIGFENTTEEPIGQAVEKSDTKMGRALKRREQWHHGTQSIRKQRTRKQE